MAMEIRLQRSDLILWVDRSQMKMTELIIISME